MPSDNQKESTVVPHKGSAILIVDDDEAICDLVWEELAEQGYLCEVASDADEALAKLRGRSFDVVLLDIKLPGMSGIDLLGTIEKRYPMTAIIMMTAVNDLETAVEAMRVGASDYVVKPFTFDKLNGSITTVLKNRRLHGKVQNTVPAMGDADYGKSVSGRSLSQINAIAYGVDAQVDYFDFHSKIVTERTIELAGQLGLPGKEIEKWAVARYEFYSERDKRIRSALSKLERNVVAQVILGVARSVCHFPKLAEQEN
jgi:CheY-like chemotaxis protein